MAAFLISFRITLDTTTGKILSFVDQSTYGSNTENYTRSTFPSKTIEIRDYKGVLLNTLSVSDDIASFNLDKDRWLTATVKLKKLDNSIIQKSYKILCTRIAEIAIANKTKEILCNDDCGCSDNLTTLRFASDLHFAALEYGNRGDAASFQKLIDGANKFAKVKKC